MAVNVSERRRMDKQRNYTGGRDIFLVHPRGFFFSPSVPLDPSPTTFSRISMNTHKYEFAVCSEDFRSRRISKVYMASLSDES